MQARNTNLIRTLDELECEDDCTHEEWQQAMALALTLVVAESKGTPITPELWKRYEENLKNLEQHDTETDEETP